MSILAAPPTGGTESRAVPAAASAFHVPAFPRYRGPDQLVAWRDGINAWRAEMHRLSRDDEWLRWWHEQHAARQATAGTPAQCIATARRRRERRDLLPAARQLARLLRLYPRSLRRALLDILAESITDIALAVAREVRHAS
jgi:hypothetical protein